MQQKSFSTFKQVAYMLYSRFKYNRAIRNEIKAKLKYYDDFQRYEQVRKNKFITKQTFEGFQNQSSLVRWGEVSDIQFGGNSTAKLAYGPGHMILTGDINTDDMGRLQTRPFIGMYQKLPFIFKVGIFNTIRVQLMGDGLPLLCELVIPFPIHMEVPVKGTILTSNQPQWITYELPIRNFYVSPDVKIGMSTQRDRAKQTLPKLIASQYVREQELEIRQIKFRMQSTQPVKRNIKFKKIQLVSTIRGGLTGINVQRQVDQDKMPRKLYTKPYFYIVDPTNDKDELLQKINTGAFEYEYEKPNKSKLFSNN